MNIEMQKMAILCCGLLLSGCTDEALQKKAIEVPIAQVSKISQTENTNESISDTPAETSETSDPSERCTCADGKQGMVSRIDENEYSIPNVPLIDQNDQHLNSSQLFSHEGPLVVQFFFTSCSTLCPILTSSMSAMQDDLGDEVDRTLIVSISIDPNHDQPDQLHAFSEQFESRMKWQFVTGNEDDIRSMQKAFDAYQQNKMQHLPLTFIRRDINSSWTRINGLLSGEALAKQFLATLAME